MVKSGLWAKEVVEFFCCPVQIFIVSLKSEMVFKHTPLFFFFLFSPSLQFLHEQLKLFTVLRRMFNFHKEDFRGFNHHLGFSLEH